MGGRNIGGSKESGGQGFVWDPPSDTSNTQSGGGRGRTEYVAQLWIDNVGIINIMSNPKVKESRRPNYAEAEVFYRNEPVKLYTGTGAKKITIDFSLHRNHMQAMGEDPNLFRYCDYIRASVLSTKAEPKKGPPIVYFDYPPTYYAITPWVVTNYSIDFNDEAGYTMFNNGYAEPNQVNIKLTLDEYRQKNGVNADDLPGQEDVAFGIY